MCFRSDTSADFLGGGTEGGYNQESFGQRVRPTSGLQRLDEELSNLISTTLVDWVGTTAWVHRKSASEHLVVFSVGMAGGMAPGNAD